MSTLGAFGARATRSFRGIRLRPPYLSTSTTRPERARRGTRATSLVARGRRTRAVTSSPAPRRPSKITRRTCFRPLPRTTKILPRPRARPRGHGSAGCGRHFTPRATGPPGTVSPPLEATAPALVRQPPARARQVAAARIRGVKMGPLLSAPPGLAVGLAQRELRYGRWPIRPMNTWFPRIAVGQSPGEFGRPTKRRRL